MGTEAKQIYKSLSFKKNEDEKSFDVILSKFHAEKILSMSVLNFTKKRKGTVNR